MRVRSKFGNLSLANSKAAGCPWVRLTPIKENHNLMSNARHHTAVDRREPIREQEWPMLSICNTRSREPKNCILANIRIMPVLLHDGICAHS